MKTVSEIIYEKRTAAGLSQRELAKKVGVSNVMVCHWEQGHCMPNILNCWDLADFFDCSIDELVGRERKNNESI